MRDTWTVPENVALHVYLRKLLVEYEDNYNELSINILKCRDTSQ